MLFGVPEHKDAIGSGATDPDGILNVATRVAVAEAGDALVVQTDLCLDEFTDHGHCGVLDAARPRRQRRARSSATATWRVAQAEAGSQLLGLSGMMDGQVAAVRDALDARGPHRTPRSSATRRSTRRRSTARSARRCSPRSRATAARTSSTPRTAARACARSTLDVAEGADIVMVKPAMSLPRRARRRRGRDPRAGLGVPGVGEYAMIEAAAANGWIDRERAIDESLLGIRRAGADAVLTYWAVELARAAAAGAHRPHSRTTNERRVRARPRRASPAA